MKVIRLKADNILRLIAVDITPEGHLVTVGGVNGAGKSSVLNSLAMALGGKAMCPEEPIRAGEAEAQVIVDLGDLRVTRKFKREKVHQQTCSRRDGDPALEVAPISCNCTPVWSETTSSLVVTNKEGASYPSPQAMLDKLLGKLTFDPLAFSREDAKRQAETLRRLVGLDVTAIEEREREAFNERTIVKKTLGIKQAQVIGMPFHKDAPLEETPLTTEKLVEAERYRKLAEEAEKRVDQEKGNGEQLARQRERLATEVKHLREQLSAKQSELDRCLSDLANNEKHVEALSITAEAARAVVPDVAAISAEMEAIEKANANVRDNKRCMEAEAEILSLVKKVEELDAAVEQARADKLEAVAAAKFPVDGLGLTDDGVTLHGLPFSQASTAEQLRVSVAIGLALNPKLKVLLVRSGNLLDEDSLKAVAAQAEAADAQVWVEWVGKDRDAVQVFIEDGAVVR